MSNDPIVEIDMQDPENLMKAINLALKATDATGWGETKTAWLHALAGDSEKLWSVGKESMDPGDWSVTAITGNGDNSRANAEFYAHARKIVLGLVSEIDRLRTIQRTSARPEELFASKEVKP